MANNSSKNSKKSNQQSAKPVPGKIARLETKADKKQGHLGKMSEAMRNRDEKGINAALQSRDTDLDETPSAKPIRRFNLQPATLSDLKQLVVDTLITKVEFRQLMGLPPQPEAAEPCPDCGHKPGERGGPEASGEKEAEKEVPEEDMHEEADSSKEPIDYSDSHQD